MTQPPQFIRSLLGLIILFSMSFPQRTEAALPPPVCQPAGGWYTSPLRVRLTPPQDGAEVWYTTDGSEPVQGVPSLRATNDIRIDANGPLVFKAKAFDATLGASETVTAQFQLRQLDVGSLDNVSWDQVTIDASSYHPDFLPANASDGHVDPPGWQASPDREGPEWLRMDFSFERLVTKVNCFSVSDWGFPPSDPVPARWRVYVTSNPSTAREAWGEPVAEIDWVFAPDGNTQTIGFSPKRGRYVILERATHSPEDPASVLEFVAIQSGPVAAATPVIHGGGDGSGDIPHPIPFTAQITCDTPGAEIWYTLDGSEPNRGAPSLPYDDGFVLNNAGTVTVKAKAFAEGFAPSATGVATVRLIDEGKTFLPIEGKRITVTASSFAPGWEPRLAIDADPDTAWHSAVANEHSPSEWLRFDFGAGVELSIAQLTYTSRADGNSHGTFIGYRIYVTSANSTIPADWGGPVNEAQWTWGALPDERTVQFPSKKGRFVILERVSAVHGWASAGEVILFSDEALPPDPAPAPEIIPGEGAHRTPLTVRITSTEPDAEIWYTLNGSEPIAESRSVRYTGEFVISQLGAVQIKARSYISGLNPSPIATAILNVIPAVAPTPDILPGGGEHEAPVTVRMTSTEGEIWYTLDGTEPQAQAPSLKYTAEFNITTLGTHLIKARTFVTGKDPSPVRSASIQVVPQNAEELIRVPNGALFADASSSATDWEAGRAIDGRHDTAWHSALDTQDSSSEWVRLAFRDSLEHQVARISYHPRRDGNPHGTFTHYRVFVTSSASTDPVEWGSPVAEGNWAWTHLSVDQFVDFQMKRGRYVIVQCVDSLEGWASASEIGIFEFPDATPRADPPGASLPPGTYVSPVRLSLTTTTPGGDIWYTTDGSDPVQGEPSFEFTGEVELVGSGSVLIKARTFAPDLEPSGTATFSYFLEALPAGAYKEVPKNTITASASSFAPGWEPFKAIDGNSHSTWHCAVDRHSGTEEWLRLDFGSGVERVIGRLKYHPRTDNRHGTFTQYRIFVTSQESDSPAEWGAPVAEGEWTWETRAEKLVDFTPLRGRFVIIQCVAAQEGWASAGEITVFETDEDALTRASPPSVSLPGGSHLSPAPLQLQSGTAGAAIWYTLDGTEPVAGEPSLLYVEPFLLTGDGAVTLKAKAFADGLNPSSTTTVLYDLTAPVAGAFMEIPKGTIRADASSFAPDWEPAKAIDGRADAWHSAVANQHTQEWLRLDFGAGVERVVGQLKYRGRGDSNPHGTFTGYEIYVTSNPSPNPNDWGEPVTEGEWTWSHVPDDRTVSFTPTSGRFVIIRCTSSLMGWASAGEVTVYTTGSP